MMVVYHGDINADAVFDPTMLTAAFGQVKHKNMADMTTEQVIQPIGLPHDLSAPLPYLALLLELGNKSHHGSTHSKIKVTVPEAAKEDKFQILTDHHLVALETLQDLQAVQSVKWQKDSWPLFRGDQVSSSIFSVTKFLTGPLSTRGLRILFDPIYNCGADPSCK